MTTNDVLALIALYDITGRIDDVLTMIYGRENIHVLFRIKILSQLRSFVDQKSKYIDIKCYIEDVYNSSRLPESERMSGTAIIDKITDIVNKYIEFETALNKICNDSMVDANEFFEALSKDGIK